MKAEKKGQIFVVFAFMMMTMFLFLLLIVNVSNLSRDKIRLQTATDAAALIMATFQARAINAITDRNFILKYPSGDTNKRFGNPLNPYSFPGIDQITDGKYVFPSKTDFESYMRVITPYQRQQDKFFEIYEKIIPEMGRKYLEKNDPDAEIDDAELVHPSLDVKREYISVEYLDWTPGGPKQKKNELVDGWMMRADQGPLFAFVMAKKNVELWNEQFTLNASAFALVVPAAKSEMWPDPDPTYKARLAPTNEQGVLH